MELVDWYGDGRLVVAELGLACCAAEFEAAAGDRPRLAAIPDTARRVLVVSGTVTHALAPRVAEAAAALAPCDVVAYGACASAGGPYWDSPVVTTVDAVVLVAAYVPGCSPTPDALARTIEALA